MKQVLIVVDMQEDFVTGVLGSQEAQAVVEPIRQEVARYREKGWPVLFTADTHSQQETSQESRHIPCHCVKGEAGWRILSQLDPKDSPVVEKPSFLCLELPRAIGPLEPEDVIALCGVCTDICVVSNALYLRARYPDNPIVVLEKLCAGTSEENHKAALAVMKSCLIEVR
ncbi:MAG: cysteine hydrolase family protein [Oscillospiraceae bacterium]|jgi:nicotinamidase/pyrazinamidase